MFKIDALRTFVTVAEAGSFRGAADAQGRTEIAITLSMKQLEKAIGGPLFEVDRTHELTALGRFTLEIGKVQLENYDMSVRSIMAFAGNSVGRLGIASVPSVAANLIPRLLPGFLKINRNIEIELLDADSTSVARMVETGLVDLGIAGQPKHSERLKFRRIFGDRFKLVFPTDSHLNSLQRPLSFRDLQGETFIRNEASDSIDIPVIREQYYAANLMVRNNTSIFALVQQKLGVALMPSLATMDLPENVAAQEIDFGGLDRAVGIIWRKSHPLTPVAADFVDHIRKSIHKKSGEIRIEST